jgi:hypothetical protein
VLAFPLASIRSNKHLDKAHKVMARLLAKGELDDGEETYLDALSVLVAVYEDEHHAIDHCKQSVNKSPDDRAGCCEARRHTQDHPVNVVGARQFLLPVGEMSVDEGVFPRNSAAPAPKPRSS